MKRTFVVILSLCSIFTTSLSQKWLSRSFQLNNSSGNSTSLPPSNSVFQIRTRDSLGKNFVWFGSSHGLFYSIDGAHSFTSFRNEHAFAHDGIFSLDAHGDTIWTSTGYDKDFQDGKVQTGGGYTYSTDNGITWHSKPQTLDGRYDDTIQYGNNFLRILPVVVPEQNVTYDLSIAPNGTIWITSWASGLRRLTNYDSTKWERVLLPPDNLSKLQPESTYDFYYDPRPLDNIKAFAVLVVNDSTVWCGTAGGINLSKDAHKQFPSWTKFSHQNQASSILGNWVIAIDEQKFLRDTQRVSRIWCTNWIASHQGENYGVSFTENEGTSWKTMLNGIKAYDFSFRDSIAYVASDAGLFRTSDGGNSFQRNGDVRDTNGNIFTSQAFYSVEAIGDTLFCGTGDGILKTIDNLSHHFGQYWEIIRTYKSEKNSDVTYSYPNPFSPRFEITRIHYSTKGKIEETSVEIFDFGMNHVRTLIRNAVRNSQIEHDEVWDGKDDNNRTVANGVYFYRVTIGNSEPIWGKVLVLQ